LADKKICIIGCGITGLSTGAVFARLGHRVRLVETDESRLSAVIEGEAAAQEPDLPSLLSRGMRTRKLSLGDDVGEGVDSSDYIFISPRTPAARSGTPNLAHMKEASKLVGACSLNGRVVVIRKTAWPGAIEEILAPIIEKASGLKAGREFGLAANPAFFSRGAAIEGCLRPSRIIVGATNRRTASDVMGLYGGIDSPKLLTDIRTAEMVKLASNCFLATKISYTNEIANLCERLGVDAMEVMKGVCLDPEVGGAFMKPGLGFGGDRLPRDLAAMISAAESADMKPDVLRAVQKVNDRQPLRAITILQEELGDLRGKRIAILGLAYKAGVGEADGSRAFSIAIELMARGARVVGYDPLAKSSFIGMLPEMSYASSAQEALLDADACVIQTDEREFSGLNKRDFELMRKKIVVDGRRVTSPTKLRKYGVTLRGIGLGGESRRRAVRR